MKTFALIVACAALCAGKNVDLSNQAPDPVVLDIGDTFSTNVDTNLAPENSFSCNLYTPTGQRIQLRPDYNPDPKKFALREFTLINGCAVVVMITDKSDEGIWRLAFVPNSGGDGNEVQHNIAVNAPEIDEISATTEVDEIEETTTEYEVIRRIEYLEEQFFDTSLGKRHEVKIRYFDFVRTESCHIKTPDGYEYNLKDAPIGIKVIEHREVACGIEINVDSENEVGEWTLFSRDRRHSIPIERRLKFTIYVEETVKATPEEITVMKGNDVYFRLANPTVLHSTCKLVQPNGNAIRYEVDTNHVEACGFMVPNVRMNSAGRWEIVFGNRIIYKAHVDVTVNAQVGQQGNLDWAIDSRVDELVGPADAVYCRVRDHNDRVWFEGFGRCRITVDRVTQANAGVWSLEIGAPGRVLTQEQHFTVTVRQAAPRPRVFTHVEKHRPEVLLTCGLEGTHNINSCKFRDPAGRILIANEGVGEDRYSFLGTEVILESNVQTSQCGLRITNPLTSDLGLWRCAIETNEDVYYAHMTVICPFVISQPNAPEIQTEPVLTATRSIVEGVEGEAVTMDCSVQAEIRYCYFRTRNGTVFSVSPGTNNPNVEYAGAGFDAGDCSIRFRNLEAHDTGAWSCHVGFTGNAPEQRASFSVNIQRPITVNQEVDGHTNRLIVSAQIYNNRAVEYCRYVRIDGLGFDARNPPTGYTNNAGMGPCWISIANPTMLDHHPWTIAARILGQDVEVYGSSDHTITMPTTTQPPAPSPNPPHPEVIEQETIIVRYTTGPASWVILSLLIVTIVLLVVNMATRKNHHWARSIRDSFRRSPPAAPQSPPEYAPKPQLSA